MTLGYKDAIHFITLRNYCYEDYPDQYAKGIGTVMAYLDMRLIHKQIKKGEPFVTCSKSLMDIYRENLQLSFIRNGVDISKYPKRVLEDKDNIRISLGLPLRKTIFIYSGGLIERKNQREAIEGFLKMNNHQEAVLLLLGDGNDRKELESTYSSYENIIFRGKVDNVCEYLQASDVYVSTSKSEGLPNGVLEAMSTGLPLLLSNIPQHIEVLEAGSNCGYSYQLGNAADLSNLFSRMLNEDLLKMGECSYQCVINNFSAEIMSERYQSLFKLLKRE